MSRRADKAGVRQASPPPPTPCKTGNVRSRAGSAACPVQARNGTSQPLKGQGDALSAADAHGYQGF